MPFFLILMTLCYPLAAHLSIFAGQVELAGYFIGLFFFAPFLSSLLRHEWPALWKWLSAIGAIMVLLMLKGREEAFVQAYPVVVYGALFIVFVSTMRSGSMPLIVRFAILFHGANVPRSVVTYGRWVTLAWSLFFLLMILMSLFLTFNATLGAWSWFANIFSYVFVGLMFVVEFGIRRIVLKGYVDYDFRYFINRLLSMDYKMLLRGWH